MTTLTWSRGLGVPASAWLVMFAILTIPVAAAGQTPAGSEWRRGGILAGFVGAGSTASDTTAAAGTVLGWEITPHLGIEGRGTWFRHDPGLTDFSASLAAIVPVLPARSVVPFASAGVGMYRATVDSGSLDVPAFYRGRMTSGAARPVFQDVMFTFGGGADVFVTPHVVLRPEASLYVITTRSDQRTQAVYGVQVAYHFRARPKE